MDTCSNMCELLAPAGSMAALHAAVAAGADAVYLGVGEFNARRGAENFTMQTLAEACDYAHLRGVRVYLTFNTLILPGETGGALECARSAYKAGVDAFIVQDLGMAVELARTLPQAELHASTQMNIHGFDGMALAADLGMKRVTLAREMSLAEVSQMCEFGRDAGVQVEVFAHGALCICYSGQCLMSSMIGGRSANRGTCAQACRLPYELVATQSARKLASPGEHLLSPKDLCTLDMLGVLVNAGVASLKIEGRMKSPEYVKAVVGTYRSVLDRALAAPAEERAEVCATPEERRVVQEAFSRGFTTAYLESIRDNSMMSYQRPNNRGASIGRVSRVRDGVAEISPTQPLSEGDIIEFWTNKGHVAHPIGKGCLLQNGHARIALDMSNRDDRAVHEGDRVFRVRSAAAAFADDPFEPRVPVDGAVDVVIGSPLRMQAVAENALVGTCVAVAQGPEVEPARTRSVSEQDVRDHVDRLGQTPFALHNLDVSLSDGAGVGFSQIHHVRAQALEDLEQQMLADYRARKLPKSERRVSLPAAERGECKVVAWAANPACARAAKRAGADEVIVSTLNFKRATAMMGGVALDGEDTAGYPKQCTLAIPTVSHDAIAGTREAACGFDAWESVKAGDTVLADSMSSIRHALELDCNVEAGPHVSAVNTWSLEALASLGVKRVWLSPELTLRQIDQIGEQSPVPLGIAISGAQELMICEHCLLMSQGECVQTCASCARRRRVHVLKDRKGFEFPVVTDILGRSHLYNSVPLDAAHVVGDLAAAGVTAFLVDATLLSVEQTAQAVGRAVTALARAQAGESALDKIGSATSGHLFRGVQ